MPAFTGMLAESRLSGCLLLDYDTMLAEEGVRRVPHWRHYGSRDALGKDEGAIPPQICT